jgi:hypothetical protein
MWKKVITVFSVILVGGGSHARRESGRPLDYGGYTKARLS